MQYWHPSESFHRMVLNYLAGRVGAVVKVESTAVARLFLKMLYQKDMDAEGVEIYIHNPSKNASRNEVTLPPNTTPVRIVLCMGKGCTLSGESVSMPGPFQYRADGRKSGFTIEGAMIYVIDIQIAGVPELTTKRYSYRDRVRGLPLIRRWEY